MTSDLAIVVSLVRANYIIKILLADSYHNHIGDLEGVCTEYQMQ